MKFTKNWEKMWECVVADDIKDHNQTNFMIMVPTVLFINTYCGQVVRVFSYRSRGPSSIPGATRFSEK
jgi:hypothetical protein